MARDLTSGVATETTAKVARPCLFYEGEFASGFLRLWTGLSSIDWDGKTWTGAGNALGVSPIEELSDIRAATFHVSLAGEAQAILAANLGQTRNGLPGRVWLGFFDSAGDLIADPVLAFAGRFDLPEILDEGERATITARYESRLIDLDRVRARRYTDEDHRIDYPNDPGFEFVTAIQDVTLYWGRDHLTKQQRIDLTINNGPLPDWYSDTGGS